ncbi:hypothetical protein [Phenylobacterium sp.]|jgi:hypothetical protein|uniref:hypothetical protein n=1 Tax=Phenylobacterium sp. TaxID=1871053 RepID=UPI002F92BF1B
MLRPRADGLLESDDPVRFAFMAPRLQGELAPDGRLDLALWGEGRAGAARLALPQGPYLYAPNRMTWPGGGLFVAQSAPAILVRDAGGARVLGPEPLAPAQVEAECEAHVRRCDRLPDADPVLRSMVLHGVHAGLSSARQDAHGRFAGLSAGLGYSAPARTYYRDAYWTLPLLEQVAPELIAAEVELLARGVRLDGEAPSGVTLDPAWQGDSLVHTRPGDWWSDHFDSPLYFALMSGAPTRAVRDRYRALAGADGLPRKPRHDRDWADNVFRSGLVAYDLGLWFGAFGEGAEAIDAALWRENLGWYGDYDGEDHLALDTLTLLRFGATPEDKARRVLDACRSLHMPWGVRCAWPPYARRADLRAKSAFPGRYHNGGDWPWLDGLYAGELLRRGLPGWRHPLTRWWETCLAMGWPGAVEHFSPQFGRGSLIQAWSSLPAAVALEHRETVLTGDPAA